MAKRPQQQQMKTSFLFIQLQAPPARALPAQSPASAASTAAPGGLEEGHIFPSPRTNFLAGWDLRRTQGLAVSPSSLLPEEGLGAEEPAAFSCCLLKEKKEGRQSPQDPNIRRGCICRCPHCTRCLVPASRNRGRLQPRPCRLANPAPVMNDGSSSPPMGWKHWPVTSAPQDLWGMDPLARNALGCSRPQATPAHTVNKGERPVLRRGAATCQGFPQSYKEETHTTVLATRAQLHRYCPTLQISTSYPAPPAVPPLKVGICACLSPPASVEETETGDRRVSVAPSSDPGSHSAVDVLHIDSRGARQPRPSPPGLGSFLGVPPPSQLLAKFHLEGDNKLLFPKISAKEVRRKVG